MQSLRVLVAFILLSSSMAVGTAYAAYPSEPIKFIVPYAAGGGTDVMARAVAPELEKALGQKLLVVNQPGAGGQIGMAALADAKPDGYTLGLFANGDFMLSLLLAKDTGYDFKSFQYICSFNISANAIILKPDSPFKTFKEFADHVKARPGTITIATSGMGHVCEVMAIEKASGIQLKAVKFGGGGESLNAIMGGHVDAVIMDQRFVPQAAEKGCRAIGVLSAERLKALPDIPTLKEQGCNVYNPSRRVLVVPAKMPKEIVDVIAKAVESFAGGLEFKEKLLKINEEQEYLKGDALLKDLQGSFDKFEDVIKNNKDALKK